MTGVPGGERLPPRRTLLRLALGTVLVGCLVAGTVTALTYERVRLGPGAVDDPANGTTVVGAQGFRFGGGATGKKPARLAGVGPNATVEWGTLGSPVGAWFFDVDPLENGTRVRERRFDAEDTHDVDLIDGDRLLVANMRNWNDTAGRSDDRLFVYDLETDRIVWEWPFREHFPNDTDGGFDPDWTHVNDVEEVRDGEYLASPRNFDQTILVNRSTGDVEWRLGRDDRFDVLHEQHNPDYLEGPDGRPTVLVADSGPDRVVEFARGPHGTWTEV